MVIILGHLDKALIICRGLPGSGKTTLAEAIKTRHAHRNGVRYSTDDFFIENGLYTFDPTQLPHAHSWNIGRVRSAMREGKSPIVVDNVFSQAWELKKYYEAATLYHYSIIVEEPRTSWAMDPTLCAKYTSKGVSAERIAKVRARWQRDVHYETVMNSKVPEQRKPGYMHPNGEELKKKYSTPIPQIGDSAKDEESEYKRNRLKR
jgi:hypothetical protein